MAVISTKTWQGEPLKAVIKFATGVEYTVYSDQKIASDGNWIYTADFSYKEGTSSVNPLGVSTSNTVNISIYDADDNLSPANTNSIYYGKIVNGVEIDLFISYDNINWSNYGVWYATSWGGSFNNGYHNMVSVSAEDKLNTIGNYDLPELPAYANVTAGDLINNVFVGLGMTSSDYYIDPSINKNLLYGVTAGIKVREFFNNICQLLFARVVMSRAGVVMFVPALSIYNNCNELSIDHSYVGSLQNKNTNAVNYNKIKVKYLEAGAISRANLFKDTTHSLVVGTNVISDITFKNKVLSIEQIDCLYESAASLAEVTSLYYQAYQNGIIMTLVLAGENTSSCELRGEGVIVSTTDKNVSVNVDNASVIGGITFEFDTKQMMSVEDATTIANYLKTYISVVSKNITMSDVPLTPKLYIGDKLTITGTDTMYDGIYKITTLSITFGEDYSMSMALIRVS